MISGGELPILRVFYGLIPSLFQYDNFGGEKYNGFKKNSPLSESKCPCRFTQGCEMILNAVLRIFCHQLFLSDRGKPSLCHDPDCWIQQSGGHPVPTRPPAITSWAPGPSSALQQGSWPGTKQHCRGRISTGKLASYACRVGT